MVKIKSVEIFICNLFGVTLLVFYLILVVVHISNLKIDTITNVTVLVKQRNLNSHTWVLFLFLKQLSLSQYGKAKKANIATFIWKSCRRRIIRVSVWTITVEEWSESANYWSRRTIQLSEYQCWPTDAVRESSELANYQEDSWGKRIIRVRE